MWNTNSEPTRKRTHLRAQPVQASPERRASSPSSPSGLFLRWTFLFLCLVITTGVTYFLVDNYVWLKVPTQLVGRWEVMGGEQDGATLEFYRNGTLRAHVNVKGRLAVGQSRVTVHGDILTIVDTNELTGEKLTQTQTIRRLTEEELILEDEQGTTFRLFRLN